MRRARAGVREAKRLRERKAKEGCGLSKTQAVSSHRYGTLFSFPGSSYMPLLAWDGLGEAGAGKTISAEEHLGL